MKKIIKRINRLESRIETYIREKRYSFYLIAILSILFIIFTKIKYLNIIFNPIIGYTLILLVSIISLKLKGFWVLKAIPIFIFLIMLFTIIDSGWQLDFLGNITFITLITGVIFAIFEKEKTK